MFLSYAAIVIYALIFTNSTGWTLLAFATFLLLTELLSLAGLLRGLDLSSSETLVAQADEKLSVLLLIKKRSYPVWFARVLLTSPMIEGTFQLIFYHGRPRQLLGVFKPQQRGHVTAVDFEATSSDLFDWLQKSRQMKLATDWYILPAEHVDAASVGAFFKQVMYRSDRGEHSFAVKNFRPYQAGDAIKQIDWKLSSRQQELMLREYQLYQTSEWVLLFYGQASPHFEAMLSMFYSLKKQLPQKNVQTLLCGKNIEQPSSADLKQYALIQPLDQAVILPNFMYKKIMIFTPELSEHLTAQAEELRRNNQVEIYSYTELTERLRNEVQR